MAIIPLIGGPGGGKTPATVEIAQKIRSLGRRCMVLRETAGSIFRDGLNHDDITDLAKANILQREIFSKQLQGENGYVNLCREIGVLDVLEHLVLGDRGLWDGRAYVPDELFSAYEKAYNLIHCFGLYRYLGIVHVVTAADRAREFYEERTEDGRNESPERACELDKKTLEAYIGHPRISIVHNVIGERQIGFDEKKQYILQAVRALLGESPTKTHRFLLSEFDIDMLQKHDGRIVMQSVQSRLLSNGSLYEKIHTTQRRENYIIHTKNNCLISLEEYSAATVKKPCVKETFSTRYWFVHDYQYVKIDETDAGTVLEIVQRHALEQPIVCPAFLGHSALVENI